jgi:hypothetical protein
MKVFRAIGIAPTPLENEKLVKDMDPDHSGVIKFNTFISKSNVYPYIYFFNVHAVSPRAFFLFLFQTTYVLIVCCDFFFQQCVKLAVTSEYIIHLEEMERYTTQYFNKPADLERAFEVYFSFQKQ